MYIHKTEVYCGIILICEIATNSKKWFGKFLAFTKLY